MYAVINSGGSQTKVTEGETVEVDLLGEDEGAEITLTPVLLVDGDAVFATPSELQGATVTARVVGTSKGVKITGFKYKSKSRSRRRWGHRQKYSTIEITGISKG